MEKRSINYFKRKWLYKRLGITSWHLDWIKMQLPIPVRPASNMAIILPNGPLKHFDGEPVLVKPEFQAPPIRVTFHNIADRANEIFNRNEHQIDRPYIHMTPRLYDAMKKRAEDMFKNQAPDDERSVARNQQSE